MTRKELDENIKNALFGTELFNMKDVIMGWADDYAESEYWRGNKEGFKDAQWSDD